MTTHPHQLTYPVSPVAGASALRGGLFPGKLLASALTDHPVLRPRLHHVLDEGVDRGSVIVSAPAGSGKTQLIAAWMRHQRTPRELAWLTLDDGDRDPLRFLKYVIAAIGATEAGHEAMESVSEPVPLAVMDEVFLLSVSKAMSLIADEVVLVLDDFQAAVGSETEVLLAQIMRYPPDKVRLIVLSRVEPSLGQTRLRLQCHLREVGGEDLAFSLEESAQLLAALGVRLSEADMGSLQARTAGWAAGLRIMAVALRGRTEPTTLPASLGAGETLAGDYLMHEVFESQPAEVQEFLLRASSANPICGDLADTLTDGLGGDRTLADLHRAHIFLERVDEMSAERGRWYRWHPLFAALLQTRLHGADPQLEGELQRTASRWHRQAGFPVDAVRHAVAGNDPETAAAVLGECWLDLVFAGETGVLRSLLELFDEHAKATRGELAVICAFVRVQERDLDRSGHCAEQAIRLSPSLPPRQRLAIDVMANVVLLHASTMTGVQAREPYESALALLRELSAEPGYLPEADRVRRALLLYHLGAYEASRWMLDEPREHLSAALSQAASLGMPHLVTRCRAQLASIDFYTGQLESARTTALDVIGAAEVSGWHSYHNLVMAYVALGGVEIFRGDISSAMQHLSHARRLVHPVDLVNRFRTGSLMHFALLADGRVTRARDELELLQELVERWDAPVWVPTMLTVSQAQQLFSEGSAEDALQLMESLEHPRLPVAGLHWRVWHAELLLLAGRPLEARAEVVPTLVGPPGWPIHVLALLVDSLACAALGLHEEALSTLTRALRDSSAEQILQPFLRRGALVRSLLEELLDRGSPYEPQALAILERLAGKPQPGASAPVPYFNPLTPREREVLQAMQGTASNEEVARRLFVSINTLRTHLTHINHKLGTSSRREAVARGRELTII